MSDHSETEERGSFLDSDPAVLEALCRLLATDPESSADEFARADIEWGLRGSD